MDVTGEDVKVSDLTVGELRKLIKSLMREEMDSLWDYVFAIEEQMPDPDAGKKLKPEFAARLEELAKEPVKRGKPAEQLYRELGLDE